FSRLDASTSSSVRRSDPDLRRSGAASIHENVARRNRTPPGELLSELREDGHDLVRARVALLRHRGRDLLELGRGGELSVGPEGIVGGDPPEAVAALAEQLLRGLPRADEDEEA